MIAKAERLARDLAGACKPRIAPATATQLELRDAWMARVESNAGEEFRQKARRFVVDYLERHGPSSGEDITDACRAAGIRPHDDRAFGPVYMTLARRGQIERAGFCERRKGHGCAGGNIWKLRSANCEIPNREAA